MYRYQILTWINNFLRKNKYLVLAILLFLIILLVGMVVRNVFSIQHFSSLLIVIISYNCYVRILKKIIYKLTFGNGNILELSILRKILLSFVFLGLFMFSHVLSISIHTISNSIITGRQLVGNSLGSVRLTVFYLMIVIFVSYGNAYLISSNISDKNSGK